MSDDTFAKYLARKAREHGDKFDASELLPAFRQYYGTGQRIQITTEYDNGTRWVRTGRVSATTGWRPAFLLMARSNQIGSSDVLGPRDRITAVQRGSTAPSRTWNGMLSRPLRLSRTNLGN